MDVSTHELNEFDYVILVLMALLWAMLFGGAFYFTQSIIVLFLGVLVSAFSILGFLFAGGLYGTVPIAKAEYGAADDRGWKQIQRERGFK